MALNLGLNFKVDISK